MIEALISMMRREIQDEGSIVITPGLYDQLFKEWITRVDPGAADRIAELEALLENEIANREEAEQDSDKLEARPDLTAEQVGYLVELIDGPQVTCFQADLLAALRDSTEGAGDD